NLGHGYHGGAARRQDTSGPAQRSGNVCRGVAGMRIVRRLTVEIERRKLVLSQRIGESTRPSESSLAEKPVGGCPTCGSTWVLVHDSGQAGLEKRPFDLRAFQAEHLHMSPAGHVWICQRSLQQFMTDKSK